VSVAITTFNSSKWLSRALDSVFAQKATFPVEVVIGDDCSSDSTVNIAHFYAERYPGTIRVLERAQNVGMCRNYYETFEQCRGEFIVWLDADDYWTDPEKLTTQVAVLREDSSINVCGHFVRWVTDEGEVTRERYPSISSGRYGIGEIIRHNFLPSCSVMFRNGIQRDLPDWYFDIAPTTDHPLWVVASLSGDIVLLERTMADYMLTPGSSYMSKGPLFWYQQNAKFLEHIEKIVPPQWQRMVRREKGKRFESMAYLLRKNGDFVASRNAAIRAFHSPHLIDNFASKSKTLLAAVVREMEWRVRGDRVLRNGD
jgi:glycosyltransferase involved in cell wall biosynthesis